MLRRKRQTFKISHPMEPFPTPVRRAFFPLKLQGGRKTRDSVSSELSPRILT
jgi:hypothetical protein